MVANAARYGADPACIVIGGSSAGGGTALMLGYGERGRRLPIRAVLDFWGGLGSRVDWIANGGPALLIVHGTADEITDFSAAQELADRAKKVGVPHELIGVPGGTQRAARSDRRRRSDPSTDRGLPRTRASVTMETATAF